MKAHRFGVSANDIILYGQSIGSVPTIDLAAKYHTAGVILHSPLLSGWRVLFPTSERYVCCDPFRNIDKIDRVHSPVLVIHGREDEVVAFNHGEELYRRCINPVDPLWIAGAGHNDIEIHTVYLRRLTAFTSNLA